MALYANEDRWDPILRAEATAEGLPVALVKAVVGNETAFRWVGDPHPVRGTLIQQPADLDREERRIADASIGVMQILTGTATWVMGQKFTREDLRDPATNIRVGVRYLSMLFNGWRPQHRWDGQGNLVGTSRIKPGGMRGLTVEETLAAYNGGPGILARRREDGSYPNQGYVDKGLAAYSYFARREEDLPAPPPSPPPTGPQAPPGAALGILVALGAGLLLFALRAR